MNKTLLTFFLSIFFITISKLIVIEIEAYNLSFYFGKDNGIFSQFISIICMSFMFYLVMSKKNRFISALVGIGFGVISGIAGYFIYMLTFDFISEKIIFPIYSIIFFITIFFFREKKYSKLVL